MLHSRQIGGTRKQRTADDGGARKNLCQPTGNMATTLAASPPPRQGMFRLPTSGMPIIVSG